MTLLKVIEIITPDIKANPHIHAMWLEGSYATGKYNDHSDIDVWLDVDDGAFDKCVEGFKSALETVGKIDGEELRGVYCENPKLAKYIFHLNGFPKEQTIELDMQEHSRKFKFSRVDHVIKILFDRDETIQWQD